MNDAVRADVPEDEYHADRTTLSTSGAKLLLPPSCPAKFREYMDHPPKPKPEYTFGHAAHRLVLGKGAEIVEVDAPDWRSKSAREVRDTACNGVAPMLTHELAKARRMAEVVHDHPIAGPLFAEGHAEVSLYADHPSGVRLRGRTDWITEYDGRLTIVDYKTAVDAEPTAWARAGFKYRYHMQDAWYRWLAINVCRAIEPRFLFVVQEKEPPFVVSVVEYDAKAQEVGRAQMETAIAVYRDCVEADSWPDYGQQIHTVTVPPWARAASSATDDAAALIAELEGITA